MNAQAKSLTLAQGKRTQYTILYPSKATPAEKHAVEELQSHLQQMTGAEFPAQPDTQALPKFAILLGSPQTNRHLRALRVSMPLQKLGEDGYIVRTVREHLILGGGRPRGTLYAVYAFLEDDLGCRWYAQDATHIPKKSVLRVPALNRTVIPAFEYREPFYTEAWDKDWAARNRCNGSFMRLDDSTGGKIGYHPFVHSFYSILPPDQYFKDHPEYYSELEGVRKVEGGQLCLTNPDVLKLTIQKVRQWIQEQPQAKIFSVSQNDWYGYCTCVECKRVMDEEDAPSGVVLRFVNAVAEAITREHPDKLIDTLAYQWTEKPPKRVRPHANVRVRMAPISNCFGHPIDTCPENKVPYDNLKAWSAVTHNLYIWHYNTNFSHYPMPFPDFDELEGSTRAYKRLGVKGIFYQGAYPPGGGGELAELRSWVMAKFLWDPNLSFWKLVDEFLKGYYGKAAKPIGDYLRMMHEAVKRDNIHFRIFDQPAKVGYLKRELVDRAEAYFEQAERAVAGDNTVLQRVQKARFSIDYTRLMLAQNDVERAKYAPIVAEKIRRFGIGQVREGQPVEEFLKAIGQ